MTAEQLDRIVRRAADKLAEDLGIASFADEASEALGPLYPDVLARAEAAAADEPESARVQAAKLRVDQAQQGLLTAQRRLADAQLTAAAAEAELTEARRNGWKLSEAYRTLSPNAQAFTIDGMRPSNPYGTPPPAPGQGVR
jgi:hypothetical protein